MRPVARVGGGNDGRHGDDMFRHPLSEKHGLVSDTNDILILLSRWAGRSRAVSWLRYQYLDHPRDATGYVRQREVDDVILW